MLKDLHSFFMNYLLCFTTEDHLTCLITGMLPAVSHRPPTLHNDVKEVPKFALFNGKEAFAIFDYTDGEQRDGNLWFGLHPLTLICFLFSTEPLCNKEIFCFKYLQKEKKTLLLLTAGAFRSASHR